MKIDSKLVEDSEYLCDLELCQLRLMKDGDVDWFILVPKREDIREWYQLSEADQILLTKEISFVSQKLREIKAYKINIASLGNMVPQLHIHIIARYPDDRAWPGAIFNTKNKKEFDSKRVDFWKKKINL